MERSLAMECIAPGGGAEGMPQLCVQWYANQIFWLIIALVAIYLILVRVALPRIGGVLAERQGAITNDIAAAEDLKLKASEAEKSYEKSLADARAEAHRIVEENKAELQAETDAAIERADAEIGQQTANSQRRIEEIRSNAMANVEQVARDVASAVVESMGGTADASQIDNAVSRQTGERAQ